MRIKLGELTDKHREDMRLRSPAEANILIGNVPDSDLVLFFGPLSDDFFIECPLDIRFPPTTEGSWLFSFNFGCP
jgi:hypothetical protein